MEPIWGPSGADRTQVGPMLAPWTLLSGTISAMTVTLLILLSSHRTYDSLYYIMPPSHCGDFGLRTNTNWRSLRIAQHRIDSNYFVLVRCHFRISSQANTNVLKCSKHSYWPCESKPILLRRIASPNVVSIRVSSYWFVSHRCTFVSIRCTFALGFAACLLRLSTLQYDAQRPHCRIGSHMFALVRVSSY